jgi:hypothetical protein
MNTCPICDGDGCRTYPLMVARWAAGKDRVHWLKIHDQLNGVKLGKTWNQLVPTRKQKSQPPDPDKFRAWKEIRACPHRTRDEGCGCSGHRCGLGKGRDGLVTSRDCLACVRAGW